MSSFKKYLKEVEKLAEAIPLDKAMEYRREWNPQTYSKIFNSYPAEMRDRQAFRIYLPYEEKEQAVYVPYDITRELGELGYLVQDYPKGLAKEKAGKRVMKIGKLLAKNPALLKIFTNDPSRALSKAVGKLVVISRHPYDVAGMSTDRGWTSCMNIGDGMNRRYVMQDIKAGTIIAYLIRADDKGIKSPISRLLIKPFLNTYDGDLLLATDSKQYGTNDKQFGEIVEEWLEGANGPDKNGLFCLNPKLYNDGKTMSYVGTAPNSSSNKDKVKFIDLYLSANNFSPASLDLDGDDIIINSWRDLSRFCSSQSDDTLGYLLDLLENVSDAGQMDIDTIREVLAALSSTTQKTLCDRYDITFKERSGRMLDELSANAEVVSGITAAASGGRDIYTMLRDRIDEYVDNGWRFEMIYCFLNVPRDGDHYATDVPVTLRIRVRDMMEYIENHREDPEDEMCGDYNDLFKLHGRTGWDVLEDGSDSDWRGQYADNPLVDDRGNDLVFGSKRDPKIKVGDDKEPSEIASAFEEYLRNGGGRIDDPAQDDLKFESAMRRLMRLIG